MSSYRPIWHKCTEWRLWHWTLKVNGNPYASPVSRVPNVHVLDSMTNLFPVTLHVCGKCTGWHQFEHYMLKGILYMLYQYPWVIKVSLFHSIESHFRDNCILKFIWIVFLLNLILKVYEVTFVLTVIGKHYKRFGWKRIINVEVAFWKSLRSQVCCWPPKWHWSIKIKKSTPTYISHVYLSKYLLVLLYD